MLVTSLKKDSNGKLHIMNGLEDHVGPGKEKWFLSILAEINHHLPDDWRLTKRENNFRIQVITPQAHFSMVGQCFRKKTGTGMLNIIDTILEKHHFDIMELEQQCRSINKKVKLKTPSLIQPNLYYFQPCPEDTYSPLFARQYERVKLITKGKKNEFSGTQYHRIHPLYKAGLDLEHYKWIKWDINGDIEFVDYPDDEYHGKDYWILKTLEEKRTSSAGEKKQRAHEKVYIEHYENLMSMYSIAGFDNKEPFPPPSERELKFSFVGSREDFHQLFAKLKQQLRREGYTAIWGKETEQIDRYFDDENLCLYNNSVSFRLRKKKDNSRITLKKRIPLNNQNSPPGLYLRLEEEVSITKLQEKALLNSERINPFPYRLIYYLAPECKSIFEVMEVKNKRITGVLTDDNHKRIEICRDIVTYKKDDEETDPEFGIEIESKGAESEVIDILAAILVDDYKLIPSTKTKYEQGLDLLRINVDKSK